MPDDWSPPMQAMPAPLPERPLEFAFEYKWDGMRALAAHDGRGLRLRTASGADATARFPELAGLASQLPPRTVVDGAVVALDAKGRPSGTRLQRRLSGLDPADALALAGDTPVHYYAFDILRLKGVDLTGQPYTARRAALEGLALQGPNWSTPPSHVGAGAAMLEVSRAMGLEGIVAKRLASPYQAGRSASWLQVGNRRRQEFAIGGWAEAPGRPGTLGSLLVGRPDPEGGLRYAGKVAAGLKGAEGARLLARLQAVPALGCPFGAALEEEEPDVHWVEPRMVCEVEFLSLTPQGLLRQASYRGLRSDRPAAPAAPKEVKPWSAPSGPEPSASAW